MAEGQERQAEADRQIETVMATLLRVGVLLSAAVVASGAVVYLIRHAADQPQYQAFRGEPADLRSVTGIVQDAFRFRGRGLIQLGLLLLVATPIARVVFSLIAFWRQRDWLYVSCTAFVLVVLAYSLLGQA